MTFFHLELVSHRLRSRIESAPACNQYKTIMDFFQSAESPDAIVI